jgi:Predicted oxidoreductases (related to aryl-alcohol dehydrogenases)
MKALDYNISSVEIIYNMFRLRPADNFFKMAQAKDVGIIARVPLASGLLSGKYTLQTTFWQKRSTNDQSSWRTI